MAPFVLGLLQTVAVSLADLLGRALLRAQTKQDEKDAAKLASDPTAVGGVGSEPTVPLNGIKKTISKTRRVRRET